MQDTASTRYLLNRRRRGEPNGVNPLAFGFDGVDDYISSNATIGRTGYDMNVSGNVTTGSDGDGSYIWINGTKDAIASTGSGAFTYIASALTYTQANSFTIKIRVKFNSFPANNISGIFGTNAFATAITITPTGIIKFGLRGSSTVDYTGIILSTGVLYDLYLVYDSYTAKMYNYVNNTLLNVSGTSGPATFTMSGLCLGDNALVSGNPTSCNKQIYHACIRNKALTQAEVDADIALGNTTKQDPSIVAYYVPENLQYNTQYMTNPKALDQSSWVKTGATSVSADFSVAPDGTTTADQVTISGTATQGISGPSTAITGSTLASKTLIVKAFVKVAAGTAAFRLGIGHTGVADYYSSNLTATAVRQEFAFTQTLTSSTSGTGFSGGVFNNTTATNPVLEVWNVRVFLTNETLRDESPNIGGFIGWKQNRAISCWLKPGVDGTGTFNSQPFFTLPYIYGYIRESTNSVRIRYSDRLGTSEVAYTLGSGFRSKVHVCVVPYFTGSIWAMKLYINGYMQASGNFTATPCNSILQTNLTIGRYYTPTYFSGNIRDTRIYTFTGSFTDTDALAIYNGGEPTSAGVTKYLHYRPPVGEVGTTTQDLSPNDRDGTLNGGVTRIYL